MFSSNNSQVANDAVFVEDVFSNFLYTGDGSTQTITNDIDLAGEGGLVWVKNRGGGISGLMDSARGESSLLLSYSTAAANTSAQWIDFLSNGFDLVGNTSLNQSSNSFASWTFRKTPKFFDVVTYTGNGTSGRTVAHNLGSVPGCIIVKRTSGDPIDWLVYHRGTDATSPQNYDLKLNTTAARVLQSGSWNDTAPTSTVFTLGDSGTGNTNGETYVAYLFAHNAGGFGLTGTDNVISCGSFTNDGSGFATVNLGYEPQWVLTKRINGTSNWAIGDTMRGLTATGANEAHLYANSSAAEATGDVMDLTSTGFYAKYGGASAQYIYIAIRRGPMKVPTDATKVFAPVAYTGNSGTQTATTGFPVDAMIEFERTNSSGVPSAGEKYMTDRLRGSSAYLETSSANSESTGFVFGLANNTGVTLSTYFNTSPRTYIIEAFRRAPSFFDEVCYTGTGTTTTQTHNLQVVPELIIVKRRSGVAYWQVYSATYGRNYYAFLNDTQGFASDPGNAWGTTDPTSTTFSLSPLTETNASGSTYVAYLFATCAGVSKVGSYTGTGTTLQVNCGFTAGARFVLIKRTDSTGSWYVWDVARGISSGNDPYLLLNSTAAEVTNTDYIDAYSAGFEISSTAPAEINASGGTFIYLSIA